MALCKLFPIKNNRQTSEASPKIKNANLTIQTFNLAAQKVFVCLHISPTYLHIIGVNQREVRRIFSESHKVGKAYVPAFPFVCI